MEAGRKLGAISRAAKERKAANAEREANEANAESEASEGSGYMSAVIAGVGVITGLVCLYFTYKQDKRATRPTAQASAAETKPPQPTAGTVPKGGSRLHSLDD